MGWMSRRGYSIRLRRSVDTWMEVEEPCGFSGDRVTPAGQYHPPALRFTVPRRGGTVFAAPQRRLVRGVTRSTRIERVLARTRT